VVIRIGRSPLGSTQTQLQGQPQPFNPSRVAGHPVSVLLFGKQAPRKLDKKKHPKLGKKLKKASALLDRIAEDVGRREGELALELCEGENACISRDGEVMLGVELLEKHGDDDPLLIAVLGHEVGHQPWTWPEGDLSHLSKKALNALYRAEEAKADRFAGRVCAELDVSPDAVCEFLLAHQRFETKVPQDYDPAEVRVATILDAYKRRKRRRLGVSLLGTQAARTRELW